MWFKNNVVRHTVHNCKQRGFYTFYPIQDELGETALHAASGEGFVEVMTVLIQRGANVNSLNKVCVCLLLFPPTDVS